MTTVEKHGVPGAIITPDDCTNRRYCDDCTHRVGQEHAPDCFFHPDNLPENLRECAEAMRTQCVSCGGLRGEHRKNCVEGKKGKI